MAVCDTTKPLAKDTRFRIGIVAMGVGVIFFVGSVDEAFGWRVALDAFSALLGIGLIVLGIRVTVGST